MRCAPEPALKGDIEVETPFGRVLMTAIHTGEIVITTGMDDTRLSIDGEPILLYSILKRREADGKWLDRTNYGSTSTIGVYPDDVTPVRSTTLTKLVKMCRKLAAEYAADHPDVVSDTTKTTERNLREWEKSLFRQMGRLAEQQETLYKLKKEHPEDATLFEGDYPTFLYDTPYGQVHVRGAEFCIEVMAGPRDTAPLTMPDGRKAAILGTFMKTEDGDYEVKRSSYWGPGRFHMVNPENTGTIYPKPYSKKDADPVIEAMKEVVLKHRQAQPEAMALSEKMYNGSRTKTYREMVERDIKDVDQMLEVRENFMRDQGLIPIPAEVTP